MTERAIHYDDEEAYPHIRQIEERTKQFYGTRLPLVLVEGPVEELVYDDIEFADTMEWGHRPNKGEYWPDAMSVPFSAEL